MAVFETLTLLSLVKCVHVLALCIGFGAAIFADIVVLTRGVFRPVQERMIETMEVLSKAAAAGLALLWITGLILVGLKINADPAVMHNEKLWAKVLIVTILTLNGTFIHLVILPMLRLIKGQRIFDALSLPGVLLLTLSAAVSSASWSTPVLLGVATELNFKVSFASVCTLYASAVVILWISCLTLAQIASRLPHPPTMAPNSPPQFVPLQQRMEDLRMRVSNMSSNNRVS
jgi:hypothetical protein